MTIEDTIAALERAHKESSPGEWFIEDKWGDLMTKLEDGSAADVCCDAKDGYFVCEAHNSLPALLAYVREQRELVRALEKMEKLVRNGDSHDLEYIGTGEYTVVATGDLESALAALDALRQRGGQ